MDSLQMDYLFPPQKCINDVMRTQRVFIDDSIDAIKDIEEKFKKDITESQYNEYFSNINNRLEKAKIIIAKYENEEYKKTKVNLVNNYIDFFLEKNNEIKTVAENALIELNKKHFQNNSLGKLSALKVKSLKKLELNPQQQEVMDQYSSEMDNTKTPKKGGKKKNRKTKKQHRKINKRLTL